VVLFLARAEDRRKAASCHVRCSVPAFVGEDDRTLNSIYGVSPISSFFEEWMLACSTIDVHHWRGVGLFFLSISSLFNGRAAAEST
jgi:hypothetical protein